MPRWHSEMVAEDRLKAVASAAGLPCKQALPLFVSFPCVCPEPVFSIKWCKRGAFSPPPSVVAPTMWVTLALHETVLVST